MVRKSICQSSLCLLILLLCRLMASAAESSPEVTLDSLRGQLKETLSSLDRMRVRYRMTATYKGKALQIDCDWIRDGARGRVVVTRDGLPSEWHSFDGKIGYSIGWHPDRPEFPREINKTSAPSEFLVSNFSPDNLIGVRLVARDLDLSILLDDQQARIVKTETKDGLVRCLVDLGVHQDQFGKSWHFSAVLAPGRDGLPVEFMTTAHGDDPESEQVRNRVGPRVCTIEEFRQVHDSTLNRDAWFPFRGQLTMKESSVKIEVMDAVLNVPVDDSLFVPVPQAGTKLIDDTTPNRRVVQVHQPEIAAAEEAERMAKELRDMPKSSKSDIHAVALPANPYLVWSWLRWVSVVALLVIGAVYAWRSWQVK